MISSPSSKDHPCSMSPEELKIPPTTYNWEFAGRYLEEKGGFTGWYGLLGEKDDEG